jgi:hypothetical protein
MGFATAYPHPPLGAMVAITDPLAPPSFVAPVDSHLGRYFYAGGYRFHVADDFRSNTERCTWKTAAATAVLLNPGEAAAMPLAPASAATTALAVWQPLPDPVGPAEPTEHW